MSIEHIAMEVINHEIDNRGMVTFVDVPHQQNVCVHIRGLAGSNYENLEHIGTAHFTEHIIVDCPSFKALANTSKLIAVCSRDEVLYGVKTRKENTQDILPIVGSIFNSNLEGLAHIELHKNIIKNEIHRYFINPEKYATRAIYKTLFPGSRLATFNTGNPEHIDAITPQNILNFYRERYHPNYFVMVVAGGLSKDDKKIFTEYYANVLSKNNVKPIRVYKQHLSVNTKAIQVVKIPPESGAFLKYDYYGVSFKEMDKYSLVVLAKILETRLMTLISSPGIYKLACTSFSTGSYGIFDTSVNLDPTNMSKVIQHIYELIQNIRVNESEVFSAKTQVINKFILSVDKLTNLTDYYSELFLHGDTNQTMAFEIDKIMNVNEEKIEDVIQKLRCQQPKITILSP